MKITITTIAALLLTTSIAGATPKPTTGNNTNTNLNHNSATAVAGASANAAAIAAQQQAQQQGQAQGQLQGQTQQANNTNTVGQSQSASNNNEINFEAGVGGIAVGAAACANSMAVGVVGASLGYSFSDKDCKIIAEAQALAALGLVAEARTHLTHIARINQSVRANQPQASVGTAISFSAELSYVTCDLDTASNVLTVRQADGFTFEQASTDCLAAHGF
jgi:hypothetical protein